MIKPSQKDRNNLTAKYSTHPIIGNIRNIRGVILVSVFHPETIPAYIYVNIM
jgi:hypothetical protein